MIETLAQALDARGYTTLTAVQESVSDPAIAGRDMLVSAQTGSGKTIGFGLAIAPRLLGGSDRFDAAGAPLALVIAPTRELALQVKRELQWLFDKAGAVVASTVGGMDMRDERRSLDRGAHIVVATPGRLRDHIMRGSIDLGALRAVVLDEADEMLDLGFREDLEFILENAPEDRQTLLFSATVPAAIAKLAKTYQKDALRIAAAGAASQHTDIAYRALRVSARDGENAIINVLRFYEAPNAIVFCNTRAMVNRLTTRLSNRGFSVVALSGELSQAERTHALQAMRDGRARVCVATDVAARGIDLPNLELVIHAELPTNSETLLHRSGRTGRAGRKGVSAMIVPPAARKKAERLLGGARVQAEWDEAPGAEAVSARDEERMLASPDWLEAVAESDAGIVDKLTEAFTPAQIAAAYLRLYRERHTAPEELSDMGAPEKPREAFGPSQWFSLEGGRAANAEPRRLLPMLCKMGNLSREDIGAIRIQPEVTLIELRTASVQRFLAAVGPAMTLENGAALAQVAGPDAGSGSGPDTGPRRAAPPAAKARPPRPEAPAAARAPAPQEAPRHTPPHSPPASPQRTTDTPPVDWNDAAAPRPKKQKPGNGGAPDAGGMVARGPKQRPGTWPGPRSERKPDRDPDPASGAKAKFAKPSKPSKPAKAAPADPTFQGAVTAFPAKSKKPGGPKQRSSDQSDRPFRGDRSEGPSTGPKPPTGKPSSKKNRARQAAARAQGGTDAPTGKPFRAGGGGPGGKPAFGRPPSGKPKGGKPPRRTD